MYLNHYLFLTYYITELDTVYSKTIMKNPKSSKYPAGPNNISGNKSKGLITYNKIVTPIFTKFAVLKKYFINWILHNLSEAALKTKGNSFNFLKNDLSSLNLWLYYLICSYILRPYSFGY